MVSLSYLGTGFHSFPGDQKKLMFCGAAAIIWTIWKTRNNTCFRNLFPSDTTALVFFVCNDILVWNSLHTEPKRRRLDEGVSKIKTVMADANSRSHGWNLTRRRIAV